MENIARYFYTVTFGNAKGYYWKRKGLLLETPKARAREKETERNNVTVNTSELERTSTARKIGTLRLIYGYPFGFGT